LDFYADCKYINFITFTIYLPKALTLRRKRNFDGLRDFYNREPYFQKREKTPPKNSINLNVNQTFSFSLSDDFILGVMIEI
jgi:hypothetical protein